MKIGARQYTPGGRRRISAILPFTGVSFISSYFLIYPMTIFSIWSI